ncbi:hypothetical protein GYMLUDRAFT_246598 [Collybiopsis luxurians FD-317 M1]|uniref:FAD-binding PCMH-type domain-containing protein n=1 Tax=Collybiopsis luxurians FD-317 M1 TaxID=944289 RepID=A0A0D0B3V3_9AGAR|nr:hypothetical protein GYMLUDRAFT_246598 [Collybiopsis luxurians FD-317 M1]
MRLGSALSAIFLAVAAQSSAAQNICVQIGATIGITAVFLPETLQYTSDVSQWLASSAALAKYSVRPKTVEVATVLELLGKTNTPFAVKGGGHTSNPGFSSTGGIQISLDNFSGVVYDKSSGTVTIGASLVWDEVYLALEQYGVTVLGGRYPSVSVAGLLLGGGYSWKTNQFCLGSDSIVAWEIAFPNGTVANVTDANDPDLAFALRGGGNNFGIVTSFVMKVYPQTKVWGGALVVTQDNLTQSGPTLTRGGTRALFSNWNKLHTSRILDHQYPKALILITFGSVGLAVTDVVKQPKVIFDQFLAINALSKDISTRSLVSMVESGLVVNYGAFTQGTWDPIPTPSYSIQFMNALVNQTSGQYSSHVRLSPSFPPLLLQVPPKPQLPPSIDDKMIAARNSSTDTLRSVLSAETGGAATGVSYSNYAAGTTTVQQLYGSNLDRLMRIKARVDPKNVMGQAGGFKILPAQ